MSPKSLLREPLVHFLVLGAALFAVDRWWSSRPSASRGRIVISSGLADALAAGFAETWSRMPNEAELKGLLDDWVREEMAVREARELGLDRDDTVVRRRMRQKLEFLATDPTARGLPSDDELRAWLESHADEYRSPALTTLRQVPLRSATREESEAEARLLRDRLRTAGADAILDGLGDVSLLPPELGPASTDEIARAFGGEFAARLETLPIGAWDGPLRSAYGWHVVLVVERLPGSLPALESVRTRVVEDVLADRRQRQLDDLYEGLAAKHPVVVATPPAAEGDEP